MVFWGKVGGTLHFFVLALTIFKQAFRIFSAFWILYQTMVWMTVSASAIINPFTQITPFTLLWAAPHRPASFVAARPRDWRKRPETTQRHQWFTGQRILDRGPGVIPHRCGRPQAGHGSSLCCSGEKEATVHSGNWHLVGSELPGTVEILQWRGLNGHVREARN